MLVLYSLLLVVAAVRAMKVMGPRSPRSQVQSQVNRGIRGIRASSVIGGAFVILSGSLASPTLSLAAQGSIKVSTLDETKGAVREIQKVLTGLESVNDLVDKKDFQGIVDTLASPPFQKFDEYCQTLVRSDAVSAEDKVSLGTIKRYGTVADAIIMIGGLGAELKAGGFVIPGGSNNANDIGVDEEDDDSDLRPKSVNVPEVRRYAKLAAGSVMDILRIANPILKK